MGGKRRDVERVLRRAKVWIRHPRCMYVASALLIEASRYSYDAASAGALEIKCILTHFACSKTPPLNSIRYGIRFSLQL